MINRPSCLLGLFVIWLFAVPVPAQEAAPPAAQASTDPLAAIRRLNPHLSPDDPAQLPMKLRSLLQDEQKFFRGTADLFYLWCRDHCADWMGDRDARVLLHGDVHIGNLGCYRAVGEGKPTIAFSVVDLDEVIEGPFQLDLLRAAVSLRFLARTHGVPLSTSQWKAAVGKLCKSYGEGFENWTDEQRLSRIAQVKKLLDKARAGNARQYLTEFCTQTPQRRFRPVRFKKDKPAGLMTPVDRATREAIVEALWTWLASPEAAATRGPLKFTHRVEFQQAVQDCVRWTRLDSSGSQGVWKYLVLVEPPDRLLESSSAGDRAPVIIELKEEPTPAAVRAGLLGAETGPDRAARVAEAHRQFLPSLPRILGSVPVGPRGFLVRSKDPWSKELSDKDFATAEGIAEAAVIIGQALGQAHRRALEQDVSKDARRSRILTIVRKVLDQQLVDRSLLAEEHLLAQYKILRKDSTARRLAATAEKFIKQ